MNLWIASLTILIAAGPVWPGCEEPSQSLKVDPVELIAGREVSGNENLFVDHARYRYFFATEANQAAFLKEPQRYEIQLGGACARMGPLSGEGTTGIFAVHDAKIYIFASESCKKSFLAAPEKLLDRPDPRPTVTPEGTRRGKELIELALRGLGGAEKVDSATTLRIEVLAKETHSGKNYDHRRAWLIRFPNEFRKDDDWNEQKWAAVAAADDSFFAQGEARSMHPQQRAALEKEFHRLPLVILRNRNRSDFLAMETGNGKVGDTPVEYVTVAFAEATTQLGIDPKKGRILNTKYRDRGPKMALGELSWTFSDFASVDGVDLPMTAIAEFDGQPAPSFTLKYTVLKTNETFDPALFRRSQ